MKALWNVVCAVNALETSLGVTTQDAAGAANEAARLGHPGMLIISGILALAAGLLTLVTYVNEKKVTAMLLWKYLKKTSALLAVGLDLVVKFLETEDKEEESEKTDEAAKVVRAKSPFSYEEASVFTGGLTEEMEPLVVNSSYAEAVEEWDGEATISPSGFSVSDANSDYISLEYKPKYVVGRNVENDIVVSNKYCFVGREHLIVIPKGNDGYVIKDNSKYGTFLCDRKYGAPKLIHEHTVKPGEQVFLRLGNKFDGYCISFKVVEQYASKTVDASSKVTQVVKEEKQVGNVYAQNYQRGCAS